MGSSIGRLTGAPRSSSSIVASPPLWALPKGTPDAGETLEETALRETREESGLQVEIERPLRAIGYTFVRGRIRFHKTVHFFLMRPIGGSTDEHDHEFDEARWIQIEEALEMMTHATERMVAEEAARLLDPARAAPAAAMGEAAG